MTLATRTLFGRSAEFDVLTSMVDRVLEGTAQVGIVEGIAGIGKTRLLQEVLAYAGERGLKVLRGAADELEHERPFRAFVDALSQSQGESDGRDLSGEIARLLAEQQAQTTGIGYHSQDADLSYRIIDSLADLLEEQCMVSPVVLGLEDLHWADDATIRALRLIGRRLSHSPLGLLVTMRPSPTNAQLDLAVDDLVSRGGRHLSLEPLDPAASSDLAKEVLSAELGPRLQTQIQRAGGTPLFIIELVQALEEEGLIERAEGRADIGEVSVPPSLRLTILRRLSFLPRETVDLLKIASILGHAFSLSALAAITGRSSADLLALLNDALSAGVLGESDGSLSFRHDLIREAIYEELPVSARKGLHREAGAALMSAGASASEVADQMYFGANKGDAEAVEWLTRAAREAAPQSPASAVRLLERALELVDHGDPARRGIIRELPASLLAMGRLAEAEAAIRGALSDEKDAHARLLLQRGLAGILFYGGDRQGAKDLWREIAQSSVASEEERGFDLALFAAASVYVGDLDGARAAAESARGAGERSGNVVAHSLGANVLCQVARLTGLYETAIHFGKEAAALANEVDTPWAGLYTHPNFLLGAALVESDRGDEGEAALRSGRASAERAGPWHLPWYQMYLAAKCFIAGQWDDAIAEAEAGLAAVEEIEFVPFAATLFPLGLLAAISFYRGDPEGADATAGEGEKELNESGPQIGFDALLWARALLLETNGQPEAARSLLETAWSAYASFGYHYAHRFVGPDLVRLSIASEDAARAESVVAELEGLAARSGIPSAKGAALRCKGLMDGNSAQLVEAVELYRSGPRKFEWALAAEDAAIALAKTGEQGDARSMLNEALELYDSFDAGHAAARAEAALRELGVRRGRRGPRRRPAFGWESLTPTELKVIELVAQGVMNRVIGERLFISPRTVETHVTHLFAKLQVSSRIELAAIAIRHLG